MTFLLSRPWLQKSIARAFAFALSLFAMALPAVAAVTAAPAPAATPASQPSATVGTVFEGVVADPVDLGEPNSPRASLVHVVPRGRARRLDSPAAA